MSDVQLLTRGEAAQKARTVTTQQKRNAARDPSGITGFDGRQTMTPPGMITA